MKKESKKILCEECIRDCKQHKKAKKIGSTFVYCSGFNKGEHGEDRV